MSIKITCDTCGRDLKPGDMVTAKGEFAATQFRDPDEAEHHFCDFVCMGWWGKEQGEMYGWYARPRPKAK